MTPVMQRGPAMPSAAPPERRQSVRLGLVSDLGEALRNLRAQKTRTLLTALGIVFGVGSVIAMLSIGAGAREQSLQFIERLGVRNILVDSRPASTREELQQRRRISPGLSERDVRILEANVDVLEVLSPRRFLHPARVLPKPSGTIPEMFGVRASYQQIHDLRPIEGRFLTDSDNDASAAVCVLGLNAKIATLGYGPAVGKHVKVNDTWLRVVGVLSQQVSDPAGGRAIDRNNVIFIPINTFRYRFWDASSFLKDELDGVDLRLKAGADSVATAKIVTAILASTHREAEDYSVTIPAALLAQQKRTQTIFTYVMVAIAAISLLVGGIGIMNIVLATVMERTREIGIRRAMGARRVDIVRQFLTESVVISIAGGSLGVAFGLFLSWTIAQVADWKTIVTTTSIVVAFCVSALVGVVFGIYPAVKASRIDPIEALRYE
jgi:putative ABC transport system permease protein